MDNIENLKRKMQSADDLESVIRTMKAIAASNMNQYEMATKALVDYYRTVELGMMACVEKNYQNPFHQESESIGVITAIVFGTDQGLVGQFNDSLCQFVSKTIESLDTKVEVWAMGERMKDRLSELSLLPKTKFPVPNSVHAITSLVGEILENVEERMAQKGMKKLYLFFNSPKTGVGYEPICQQLLPLDHQWQNRINQLQWPTNRLPEVVGGSQRVLPVLFKEYLFVSIYRACAESLASENSSRLKAMERAEKNIDELLEEFMNRYQQLRQNSIDEELFDIVSGFEAMSNKRKLKF